MFLCFFFFFSSRRRHTIFKCDWSSDVCSSDLSTGQIALFRFTHETGAAAGVRRIEALTGPAAYRHALELEHRLAEASGLLKTQPEHLARRIEAMLEENRKLERRIDELLRGSG